MAFDLGSVLTAVQGIVTALPGMQTVYMGVPESLDARVSSYITLGPATATPKANQLAQWQAEVSVTFAHRVVGAEQAAEMMIAQMVQGLTLAILNDRTLGGIVTNASVDTSANGLPRYTPVAASEYREYLCVVRCSQQQITP